MRYSIPQANMESLRKKIVRIQNKCKKYGCDFNFEVVGEEMRKIGETKKGKAIMIKCFVVEAEGVAIINDWKFVASLEHTSKGNIINKAVNDVEVPERYYNSEPICEHCNSRRRRNNTYIVMNTKTGEFKQVGKSCLKDFTNGMSAEGVASFESMLKDLADSQSCDCFGSSYGGYYYNQQMYLQYVVEAISKFGYARSNEEGATAGRVCNYIWADIGICRDKYDREFREMMLKEMEQAKFKHDREDNIETARKAVEWALAQSDNSNYMHNLKVVCQQEEVECSNTGILTSLIPVYYKAIERELKLAEKKAKEENSQWQGNVGDKLTVKIVDCRCVCSWETQWGYTHIFKMADEAGNIYTWKTGNYIEDEKGDDMQKFVITGKIKAHNEFRGIKQTELTRCRVSKAA